LERDESKLERVDFFAQETAEEASHRVEQARAGNATAESLVARVQDAKLESDGKLLVETHDQMVAVFHVHPNEIDRAARAVVSNETSSVAAHVVLGALSGASTPKSLDALGDILKAPSVDSSLRAIAAGEIALASTTSPGAIAALREAQSDTAPDVRSASTLALGAASPLSADQGPGIFSDLMSSLEQAKTPGERALYLRALGNAGNAAAFSVIADAIDDSDVMVQIAAVTALRFIKDPQVDPLLDSVLTTSPTDDVREAALFAIGFREPTLHVSVIEAIGKTDPSESVRMNAVDLLQRMVNVNPSVVETLRAISTSDSSENVRTRAAAAISFKA
jgi:HEAT repeat protein